MYLDLMMAFFKSLNTSMKTLDADVVNNMFLAGYDLLSEAEVVHPSYAAVIPSSREDFLGKYDHSKVRRR